MELDTMRRKIEKKFLKKKGRGYVFAVMRLELLWQQLLEDWLTQISPSLYMGGAVSVAELEEIRDKIVIPARHKYLGALGFTKKDLDEIRNEELEKMPSPSTEVN